MYGISPFALGMVDRDRLQQQTDPVQGSVGSHGIASDCRWLDVIVLPHGWIDTQFPP
jgi:hypothetical protein